MVEVAQFFLLQGMRLAGSQPHLIQSITNVIIKIILNFALDRWGGSSLLFEAVLCLSKTIFPILHKCCIAARP